MRQGRLRLCLIRMLRSEGLTWADIIPVAMNVADGQAAFSSGRLDTWAIYGFPIQRAIATDICMRNDDVEYKS